MRIKCKVHKLHQRYTLALFQITWQKIKTLSLSLSLSVVRARQRYRLGYAKTSPWTVYGASGRLSFACQNICWCSLNSRGQREKERGTERQTDRLAGKETDTGTDTQRDRGGDGQAGWQANRETETKTETDRQRP